MPWGLAIGALVGGVKNQLVDVPREKKQRALAAATQKYAPWTGLQAQPVQQADLLGNALQFGSTGAGMKNALYSKNSDAWTKLLTGAADAAKNGLTTPKINMNVGGGGAMGGPGSMSQLQPVNFGSSSPWAGMGG